MKDSGKEIATVGIWSIVTLISIFHAIVFIALAALIVAIFVWCK